ncbi:MAG TPA: hypothetical protein GXX17_05725 [Clostridiales bacterium]|nr:hypothetical protein [Clostridiales bacterium]
MSEHTLFCKVYVIPVVIISLIAGIVETVLYILGYFPNIVATLWIALGIAVIMLIGLIAGIIRLSTNNCIMVSYCARPLVKAYTVGVIGTITSVALTLATYLNNQARSTLVLVALSAYAFSMAVVSFVILVGQWVDRKLFKRID